MGDDTWLHLFPPHGVNGSQSRSLQGSRGFWAESHGFPSFNVKDLHSVDDGVLRLLVPALVNGTTSRVKARKELLDSLTAQGCPLVEDLMHDPPHCKSARAALAHLEEPDWDVLVAHFLGVDHVGHRFGPEHPAMAAKLQQMDRMVADVVASLPRDTLLVVLGDHGMTPHGNHGGATPEEVTAGLLLYAGEGLSPEPAAGQEHGAGTCECDQEFADRSGGFSGTLRHVLAGSVGRACSRVRQVDLVPTLALLLGLPIPFGNLGRAFPDLQYGPAGFQVSVAAALRQNAKQVLTFMNSHSALTGDFSPATLEGLAELFREARRAEQAGETLQAIEAFGLMLNAAFEECLAIWATFDLPSMLVSLLACCLAYFTLVWASTREKEWRVRWTKVLLSLAAVLCVACVADPALALKALGQRCPPCAGIKQLQSVLGQLLPGKPTDIAPVSVVFWAGDWMAGWIAGVLPSGWAQWAGEVAESLVILEDTSLPRTEVPFPSGDVGVSLAGSHDTQSVPWCPSSISTLALCTAIAVPLSTVQFGRETDQSRSQPSNGRGPHWLASPALQATIVLISAARFGGLFSNSFIENERYGLLFLLTSTLLVWALASCCLGQHDSAWRLVLAAAVLRLGAIQGERLHRHAAVPQETPLWDQAASTSFQVVDSALSCFLPGLAMSGAGVAVPLLTAVAGKHGVSTRHPSASIGRGAVGAMLVAGGVLGLAGFFFTLEFWRATIDVWPAWTPSLGLTAGDSARCTLLASAAAACLLMLSPIPLYLPCCAARQGGRLGATQNRAPMQASVLWSRNMAGAATALSTVTPPLALLLGPSCTVQLAGAALSAHLVSSAWLHGTVSGRRAWEQDAAFGLCLAMLGPFWFHMTGHDTRLSALHYASAFTVSEDFHSILSPLLVAINTGAAHIVIALAAFPAQGSRAWAYAACATALPVLGMSTFSFLARRHLMVWAIFAPKLLFEVFFLAAHTSLQALATLFM